ncbi:ATP-dependent nuclease [Cohnella soli]|uniref:ATP-dependent endonuclease n=1 Tax=Cohnella soli TaxID=425005 RepID=A0ABW0HIZ9_9BACL
MAISQQRILSVHFEVLKNLKNVTIDFTGSELTAIMGINGSGKSTILHALACCYQPIDNNRNRENYKMFEFFTPNTDALWAGSKFKMTHSYRNEQELHNDVTVEYTKSDRWNPKYQRRPFRNTLFIGVKTCVPRIEEEKKKTIITYVTSPLTDDVSRQVREKAGYVMNRQYTSFTNNRSTNFEYIGVEHNNNHYSSLSMGAGEQRLFYILSKVFSAPKNSLILIDEIDLLLHIDALKKLITVLKQRAEDKDHQIVFTTHAPAITDLEHQVNIRHLWNTANQTFCLNETKPDTISRLTGQNVRPLEIFVEDDLSQAIVNHTCQRLNMQRFVTTKRFGAAVNCFTVACGLLLNGTNLENTLFLLDGDVYKTHAEKLSQMEKAMTGNDPFLVPLREAALNHISQYCLPDAYKPEQFIHNIITTIPEEIVPANDEIKRVAGQIQNVNNAHAFVNEIIEKIGFENKILGLHQVVEVASRSPRWIEFILPLQEWLLTKQQLLQEPAA